MLSTKLLIVTLFAFVAASKAEFVVVNTYSDANCTSTNMTASFALANNGCPNKKRSADLECLYDDSDPGGYYYTVDYSLCGTNNNQPTFPDSWIMVNLTGEPTCSQSTSMLAVPSDFSFAAIGFYTFSGMYAHANASISCDIATGNVSFRLCFPKDSIWKMNCFAFNIPPNTCTPDIYASVNNNFWFASQSFCAGPPITQPPLNSPIGEPIATPSTNAPTKAPAAKTSDVVRICASAFALYSILFLL